MSNYKTTGSMASTEICVKFVANCFLIYFQLLDTFFYGHKKTVSLKVIPLMDGAEGALTPEAWGCPDPERVGYSQ